MIEVVRPKQKLNEMKQVAAKGLSFGEITKELGAMWKVLQKFFFGHVLIARLKGDDGAICRISSSKRGNHTKRCRIWTN